MQGWQDITTSISSTHGTQKQLQSKQSLGECTTLFMNRMLADVWQDAHASCANIIDAMNLAASSQPSHNVILLRV